MIDAGDGNHLSMYVKPKTSKKSLPYIIWPLGYGTFSFIDVAIFENSPCFLFWKIEYHCHGLSFRFKATDCTLSKIRMQHEDE